MIKIKYCLFYLGILISNILFAQIDLRGIESIHKWICQAEPVYTFEDSSLQVFRLPVPPDSISAIILANINCHNIDLAFESFLYLTKFGQLYIQSYDQDFILDDIEFEENALIKYARIHAKMNYSQDDYLAPNTTLDLANALRISASIDITGLKLGNSRKWIRRKCKCKR